MLFLYKSASSRAFELVNGMLLVFLAFICFFPFLHLLAVSLSDSAATLANQVTVVPVGFNLEAYKKVLSNTAFFQAFGISVMRTVVGTGLNLLLIVITAYPLSKNALEMKGRNAIIWFYIFPMLFNGGLIPYFLVVKNVGLIDSFWSLVLPGAVQIFNILMMMHFFRGINKSMIESAMMDGAGHLTLLFRLYLPVSMASVATLSLFAVVSHWNDWFTGLLFLNDNRLWPLQTYLKQMIVSIDVSKLTKDDLALLGKLSNKSLKAAQLLVATVPILFLYPFLQKYFVSGITVGSVKE
ncbi:MAG: transporter permease [Paenibacillaceae bacterium]|jgi:putative aldouronate transport system permease protein|nr:transporter permease [Paenibacillaceae bacterium]